MKYDIYFHNDLDGRASAAMMLAYLRSRGDDIEHYIAMTYGHHDHWFDRNLFKGKNAAVVVDFTYHPGAAWWFDHHATTFKKPEWKKYFKSDPEHRLDAKYYSCCHLVYDSLRRDFSWRPGKHLAELAKVLDVVDGARYRSAKQTIEMKEPGVQMNAYVEGMPHDAREDKHMIELMATRPLAAVVRDSAIARSIAKLKKNVTRSLGFYKKNLEVSGRSTFIDLSKDPLNGLLRYAPYYLCPKSVYSIRVRRKGKLWYLGVAANPWRSRENRFDLGALMKKYNGGGHYGVGATEFETREATLRAIKEIDAVLRQ